MVKLAARDMRRHVRPHLRIGGDAEANIREVTNAGALNSSKQTPSGIHRHVSLLDRHAFNVDLGAAEYLHGERPGRRSWHTISFPVQSCSSYWNTLKFTIPSSRRGSYDSDRMSRAGVKLG